MSDYVIVLTTFPSDADVEPFASRLVDDRLAACVNILPSMRSIYRWENAVERTDERQLIIKTSENCLSALEALIATLHPYDVPEFLVIHIKGGSTDYLAWLAEAVKPSSPSSP